MHPFWNSSRRLKVAPSPRRSLVGVVATTALLGTGIAGCGGGSPGVSGSGGSAGARSLLSETFSGSHPVRSGVLTAGLTLDPRGSTVLTQPLTLSFGGPFQGRGAHALPESDFAIAITFQGHTGRLGIISTGTRGYVTLSNQAYALPAGSFRQLESGVSAVGGSSGSGSTLSHLGIHPQTWLTDPQVVGTAQIGGVQTDHVHGRLALAPLLADVSRILSKASTLSATASALKPITSARQRKLAGEITGASFDLWTGVSDHTLRKLTVTATLPVTGKTRTQFGGLSSATLSFTLAYSDIGRPETVTAPASAGTYTQFQQRLASAVLGIEQVITGAAGGTSATGGGVSGGTSTAGSGSVSSYSQCIAQAGGSVTAIQRCAALLNGAG